MAELSQENLGFLMKNTNYSEEQIQDWYKEFLIDSPNGKLTKEKFIKVFTELSPIGGSGSPEAYCEHAFRTFDTDNSGFVDFKEFLLSVNVISTGTPEQKLEWAFRMYDIDGNGTIDEKEMIKIIKAFYDMAGQDVANSKGESPRQRGKRIFEKLDRNHDEKLTRQEFMDGCLADQELYQLLTNDK